MYSIGSDDCVPLESCIPINISKSLKQKKQSRLRIYLTSEYNKTSSDSGPREFIDKFSIYNHKHCFLS